MDSVETTKPFAVITGASRGIGAEYARALSSLGYDLLLVARDILLLRQLSEELMQFHNNRVEWESLDLSQPGAGQSMFAAIQRRQKQVDLLVNNAGFGFYGYFRTMPVERLQAMLHLHVTTIVESIRFILPGMVARKQGTIITVASVAGFFPLPYLALYGATKDFLISFSRALAEETRGSGVHIQVCCPGNTKTDFHETAGFESPDPIGADSPAQVVSASLAALASRKHFVTIGLKGRFLQLLAGLVPNTLLTRLSGSFLKPKT